MKTDYICVAGVGGMVYDEEKRVGSVERA